MRSFVGLEFSAVGYPSRVWNNTRQAKSCLISIRKLAVLLVSCWKVGKQIRAVACEREGAVDLGNSTLSARDVYTSIVLLYTRIYIYICMYIAFSINA